jgi:hypothetical protein
VTAPSPSSWDEDAIADDCEGCASPEIAETGSALVGCARWAALVFTAFVVWVIFECLGGAK